MAGVEQAPPAEPPVPHRTVSERAAGGRAARKQAPRSSHSELAVAADRDAIALLEEQARSRVAELVPIRYGRCDSVWAGSTSPPPSSLSGTISGGSETSLGCPSISLRAAFRRYRRTLPRDLRSLLEGFRYADLAEKVVGVGSVGTRCWVLLLLGRDPTGSRSRLISARATASTARSPPSPPRMPISTRKTTRL
jgi:hypothetical protein